MSLEDRIKAAADQALGTLVQQVLEEAASAQEVAVRAARAAAFEEAEVSAQKRVADAEARAAEDVKASVAAARIKEREGEMAEISRLLDSIRGLDGATTLSEVLDALATAAAREAARAAVVVLRGDRIQGWKMSGFGPRDSQPKSIDLSLAESGVIGLAIGAARPVTTRDSQSAAIGPGFETLPSDRMGLAVPVIVGGRVVAVVYADAVSIDGDARRPVPSGWPELIEVLTRHAGRCLEALTALKTAAPRIQTPTGVSGSAGASGTRSAGPAASSPGTSAMMQMTDSVAEAARRTARLLVSDIRLFHEPAVSEGRRQRNLLERLAPEIARAREAYNDQVPAVVRSETDYFHQELIRTLAGGDATLLGQFV